MMREVSSFFKVLFARSQLFVKGTHQEGHAGLPDFRGTPTRVLVKSTFKRLNSIRHSYVVRQASSVHSVHQFNLLHLSVQANAGKKTSRVQ